LRWCRTLYIAAPGGGAVLDALRAMYFSASNKGQLDTTRIMRHLQCQATLTVPTYSAAVGDTLRHCHKGQRPCRKVHESHLLQGKRKETNQACWVDYYYLPDDSAYQISTLSRTRRPFLIHSRWSNKAVLSIRPEDRSKRLVRAVIVTSFLVTIPHPLHTKQEQRSKVAGASK
jgi:hypothetical protein